MQKSCHLEVCWCTLQSTSRVTNNIHDQVILDFQLNQEYWLLLNQRKGDKNLKILKYAG